MMTMMRVVEENLSLMLQRDFDTLAGFSGSSDALLVRVV